jgi:hypothetical protein
LSASAYISWRFLFVPASTCPHRRHAQRALATRFSPRPASLAPMPNPSRASSLPTRRERAPSLFPRIEPGVHLAGLPADKSIGDFARSREAATLPHPPERRAADPDQCSNLSGPQNRFRIDRPWRVAAAFVRKGRLDDFGRQETPPPITSATHYVTPTLGRCALVQSRESYPGWGRPYPVQRLAGGTGLTSDYALRYRRLDRRQELAIVCPSQLSHSDRTEESRSSRLRESS